MPRPPYTGRGQHGLAFPPSVGPSLCTASIPIKTALDLLPGPPSLSSVWLRTRIGSWFWEQESHQGLL